MNAVKYLAAHSIGYLQLNDAKLSDILDNQLSLYIVCFAAFSKTLNQSGTSTCLINTNKLLCQANIWRIRQLHILAMQKFNKHAANLGLYDKVALHNYVNANNLIIQAKYLNIINNLAVFMVT